jgi:Cytochrome P450
VNVIHSYYQLGWIDGSEGAVRALAEQWRDRNACVVQEAEACGKHLTVLRYEELIASPTLLNAACREIGISVISELRPDSRAGRLHMKPEHQRIIDEICGLTVARLNGIRRASTDAFGVVDSAPASVAHSLTSQWPVINARLKSPVSIPESVYVNAQPDNLIEQPNSQSELEANHGTIHISDYARAFSLVQQNALLSPVEYIWTIAPDASSSSLHRTMGTLLSTDAGIHWLNLLLDDMENCFSESAHRVINWREAFAHIVHAYFSMLPGLILDAARTNKDYDAQDEQAAYLTPVSTGFSDCLAAFLTTVMRHCLIEPDFAPTASQSGRNTDLAIRELLRFYPPIQNIQCRLRRNAKLPETSLPEGTSISIGIAAANRDPAVFSQPNTFLPHRMEAEPLTLLTDGPAQRGLTGQILFRAAEKLIHLAARCTLTTPDNRVPEIHYDPLGPCGPRYLHLLITRRV